MIDGTDRGETRRQHFYFLSSLVAFHLQREYLMGWSLVGCLWIESGIRKPKGGYRSLGGGDAGHSWAYRPTLPMGGSVPPSCNVNGWA